MTPRTFSTAHLFSRLFALLIISIASANANAAGTIKGVVSSADGSEEGVWVIAETRDLGTSYRKIVVTDKQGRFLLPELPEAEYSVWSRGYGLIDSAKQTARPGDKIAIKADTAKSPVAAAQIFPANYWLSLLRVPDAGEFTNAGYDKNGINPQLRNQAMWIDRLKDGCQLCHQLGNKVTRGISNPDDFDSTKHAWDQKLRMGGFVMIGPSMAFGRDHAIDLFAEWTDRINAGEVPASPPRPKGVEQNVVITQWGWSNPTAFIHDNVSTDKRHPTLNSNGQVYGVNMTQGKLVITDVVKNESREIDIPMRVETGETGAAYDGLTVNPSNPHNPMMDAHNRVWLTSTIRPRKNDDWCLKSDHPSVKRFPLTHSDRQASYFDVETEKFVLIDTCFATHHLQFASDKNDTLWFSGDLNVVGWLDTKKFDETKDERISQGWCPTILDTNGDGKIGEYVEPGEPLDPNKDTRVSGFAYGLISNPTDGSVWFARPYPTMVPGQIVRVDPKTCMTEVYEPPFEIATVPKSKWGFGPRGVDVDTNGVVWAALSGSGHIASFDRRKCKVMNGPSATGQHCPEGWTLHKTPGPQMKGAIYDGNADFHYLIWVDQFNTLGLGKNAVLTTGTSSDSLIAWLPDKQEMVTLRVPYPLGFYTRGMDGRIDNPKIGWKGRGVWASNNTSVPWHTEGGEGMTSDITKFQIRPHPLAE